MISRVKIALVALLLVIVSSCKVSKPQISKDFINADKVAFVEIIQTQDGELISGTVPAGRRIDGPTYRFDKETKQLDILRKGNFDIDTLKAFLGTVRILKGVAGTGLSMRLNPIGKLPYTIDNLTISMVGSKGVSIIFDKKELLLKEGEEWETSTIDTINKESQAIIKYTKTYSIQYHGLIDKKGVTQ